MYGVRQRSAMDARACGAVVGASVAAKVLLGALRVPLEDEAESTRLCPCPCGTSAEKGWTAYDRRELELAHRFAHPPNTT